MSSHGAMRAEAIERSKPRKKVLESVEGKRSANGGFIARYRFDNSGPGTGYHEPEEHVFGADEGHKFLAHIGTQLGIGGKSED